jgi:hypothetical protein
VGLIAEGMQADLVVLKGNPSHDISDVRNVELVFKDGVGTILKLWCQPLQARSASSRSGACSPGQSSQFSLLWPFLQHVAPYAHVAAIDWQSPHEDSLRRKNDIPAGELNSDCKGRPICRCISLRRR